MYPLIDQRIRHSGNFQLLLDILRLDILAPTQFEQVGRRPVHVRCLVSHIPSLCVGGAASRAKGACKKILHLRQVKDGSLNASGELPFVWHHHCIRYRGIVLYISIYYCVDVDRILPVNERLRTDYSKAMMTSSYLNVTATEAEPVDIETNIMAGIVISFLGISY